MHAGSQVRTETTADLNVLHERRSKAAAEEYERRETEMKRRHGEETSQLRQDFQAVQDVLKVKGHAGPRRACGAFSCVCVAAAGGAAAAVGGAAGLPAAEEEGPGVHLQQGPAEEHPGHAPPTPAGPERLSTAHCRFLSAGPRQPRCILGVRAGVSGVRHRDEERASAGAEQEASEHGRAGKRHCLLLSSWIHCVEIFFFVFFSR